MMNSPLDNRIIAFVDGACSGNPGPGGWGAVVAFPDGFISEIGGRVVPTTNNRMELTAVIRALEKTQVHQGALSIHTDSTYVIRGITQWIWAWKKRGWVSASGKDVANADLWKTLSLLVGRQKIDWKYVRGHSGVPGNERADEIAVSFSHHRPIHLYEGQLIHYSIPIYDIPEDTSLPEMRPKVQKVHPYSYLSLVGGKPMRHATWSACERRVKGQSGAKFKKAINLEEEVEILRHWGLGKDDLLE